jgi:hypothetical protein
VPIKTADLISTCPLNGVKWEVDFVGKVFFSEAAMSAQATTGAGASACSPDEDYAAVCNVVSDLPPYICTREVPPATVTYLGAAAGGAHLIYACLVVMISGILTVTSSSSKAAIYFRGPEEVADNDNDGSTSKTTFALEETTIETPFAQLAQRDSEQGLHPGSTRFGQEWQEEVESLKGAVADLSRLVVSQSETIRAQAASITSLQESVGNLIDVNSQRNTVELVNDRA